MKRLLLLPALLFGLFFVAQAQEYEEVHGIKIGAPIEEVEGLDGYDVINLCDLTFYHSNQNISTKRKISSISVVDDLVVAVDSIDGDFESRLELAQKKYGGPEKKEDETDDWITFKSYDGRYRVEVTPEATVYMMEDFYKSHDQITYGCE